MISLRHVLRRHPRLFDCAKALSRRLGNRTKLYEYLDALLPRSIPFTFLQAGANDGLSDDPFREFVIRPEAKGILMEPVPYFFEQLKLNYHFKTSGLSFEQSALSYTTPNASFYTLATAFLESIPYDPVLWGIAGFSRNHLLEHLPPNHNWEPHISAISVPSVTVEQAMERHGYASLDCLFLDMEGHEPDILLHMDYAKAAPKIIVYEHIHLGTQKSPVANHLSNLGFTLHECQNDIVAVWKPV